MSAAGGCPVPWCTWDPGECSGDHWASPGFGDWPEIEATAYQPSGPEYVTTAPTWGEVDGLAPAVQLLIRRVSTDNVALVEETFDLTPDEAEALANQLIRATRAARETLLP